MLLADPSVVSVVSVNTSNSVELLTLTSSSALSRDKSALEFWERSSKRVVLVAAAAATPSTYLFNPPLFEYACLET